MSGAPEAARILDRLAPGTTAFVDGDWLAGDPLAPVAAVILEDGALRFGEGAVVEFDAEPRIGVEEIVAGALAAVAEAAFAAIPETARDSVEVTGTGYVAGEVRRLLGRGPSPAGRAGGSPRCIVEATGDPQTIEEALLRLEEMGTLVVVGPAGGRRLSLNVYKTIHARCTRAVGIPPPLAGDGPWRPLVPVSAPARVGPDGPFDGHAWYRVDT